MVLQPNVTHRTLLWICVVIGGLFPSFCAAQTAAANREQIRTLGQKLSAVEKALADLKADVEAEKRQNFGQRLSTLERAAAAPQANITDEQKAYLSRVDSLKEKFNGIKDEMALTAERVAGTEMNISYNYFTIFALLSTLMAAAGTLGAAFIKRIVLDSVKKDVDEQLREGAAQIREEIKNYAAGVGEDMKVIARFETDLVMAESLFKMSFAWWEQYEEHFRKLLPKRKMLADDEAMRDFPAAASLELGMARILSERGRKIANGPSFSGSNKDDNRPWLIRARLTNLWVYNTTAELLCGRRTASNEEKVEILRSADSLIELTKDSRAQEEGFWYNFHETAAFAMMHLGNEGTQERGRALIRDLCAKKTPGTMFQIPPDEWLAQLRTENEIDEQGNAAPQTPSPSPIP
jgi:hypothetical protein